jgi:nitrogen fixation protein NifT
MKVMICKSGETFSAYVAKKDLEEDIVVAQVPTLWGGWVELANGWRLQLPDLATDTRLPITVEARKLAADCGAD